MPSASDAGAPSVFMKFVEDDVLAEMGRLLFHLVQTFASNGYRVSLQRLAALDRPQPGRPYLELIARLPNVSIVDGIPQLSSDCLYIFDREDRACARMPWRKKVRVRFDIFSSYALASLRGNDPLLMPYPLHPLQYSPDLPARLAACRAADRRVRVFFAGDTRGYKKNRIHFPAPKLTRSEILDTVRTVLQGETIVVQDEPGLRDILSGDYQRKVVIVDGAHVRVSPADWLTALSQADFFLAPPGYVMPMCHNIVEAMAAGSVPITNYPEWFTPSLTHMQTCVAFDDAADLVAQLTGVLAMSSSEVDALRANVTAYYDDHLRTEHLIGRIEARPQHELTLLMITDGGVARSPSRLNQNSVLLRHGPWPSHRVWGPPLHRLLAPRTRDTDPERSRQPSQL
jgi:hypothetical protein